MILSASVSNNAKVFANLMNLHVPVHSKVADVTYGRGSFWKLISPGDYILIRSDITTGIDARSLPYESSWLDAVIFDPPYMHTSRTALSIQGYEAHYRNQATFRDKQREGESKYHEAVLDLYVDAATEAHRCLKTGGIYVVKCQDEVCQNRQRLTHVEVINALSKMGFYCRDLFIVVRSDIPPVSRMKKQIHARKNHSYFLVFAKGTSR